MSAFTWSYLGVGCATCVVDGANLTSDGVTGTCASPLRYLVNDTRQHTLVVTFTDVCGVTRRDFMNFSVAGGWSTNATADGLPLGEFAGAGSNAAIRNTSKLTARAGVSGAARAGPAGAAWAAAAALLALGAALSV